MCDTCLQLRPFDSECAYALAQTVLESGDAAGSIATTATMNVGDDFAGYIDALGDRDYVRVSLTAGQTYDITLTGRTLSDPTLAVLNASGVQVASNDDYAGNDSYLSFTASTSGTYYLSAAAFGDSGTGSYTLDLALSGTPPGATLTIDEIADYLTEGYWGGRPTYFTLGASRTITYDISALNAQGQFLAEYALDAWADIANINFVATSGGAQITFTQSGSGASTTSDTIWRTGYDQITASTVNIAASWLTNFGSTVNSYGGQTYLHEVGHALGLGHAGDYNGAATYGVDNDYANDSWQASVMSYFSQQDNTAVNADYAIVVSPMLADIIAIQTYYGAASSNGGDTVYGYNSTVGGYLGDLFQQTLGEANLVSAYYSREDFTVTLYDTGGTDTIDLSGQTVAQFLNMAPEAISNVLGLIGNLSIARGTIIENAIMGSGNDTVIGNDAGNRIFGLAGNDSLDGGAGADLLAGGLGDDWLLGQAGQDTLNGHAGNDTIDAGDSADFVRGGSGADSILGNLGDDTLHGHSGNDTLDGGDGNDVIRGHGDDDLMLGQAGDDSLNGGCGLDTLDGGVGNDSLFGASGADSLIGGADDDWLSGGTGNDTLAGGTGNDSLRGDSGYDVLNGGAGNDTLSGGYQADVLSGGDNDDLLLGDAGNDTLSGDAGADTLDGGLGNDSLTGGGGNDEFRFRNGSGADLVTDFTHGADTLALDQALWGGGLTAAQVVTAFASASSGTTIFNFGDADVLTLTGLLDLGTLDDDIVFL